MITILGKIELPEKKINDIICPSCGKNCNTTGLIVISGNLQPCDECQDMAQIEYWEQEEQLRRYRELLKPQTTNG